MSLDQTTSPVGWYVGSYLIRFVELKDKGNGDPEARFLSWENTVIVKARSPSMAYDKVAAIAKAATKRYKGGQAGVPVQWVFEGTTELLPICEALDDGAEIMWGERSARKLENLRKLVRGRRDFVQ